jgi:hypothetical protein
MHDTERTVISESRFGIIPLEQIRTSNCVLPPSHQHTPVFEYLDLRITSFCCRSRSVKLKLRRRSS